MAVGMAISVLDEALLPAGAAGGGWGAEGGKPLPKDEKDVKEWIRNKVKALASPLGRLGVKAAEALPGIIRVIICWILNKASDVVDWVLQNLWALVAGIGCRHWLQALAVGIGGLLYMYMVTK